MATEGAGGEPPAVRTAVRTLSTALPGAVPAKCELNMDNLSKPELLTLLSIMEGELEARDLVIETLRARRKEVFVQERYGLFTLTDPLLALQRDHEARGGERDQRAASASPMAVLEMVTAHCRRMQERMSAQLVAAESRQKKLEQEKQQLQSLETEHRKLSAQLKDERLKNKHVVMLLVHECKQLAARVVEEGQRCEDLSSRLDEESRTSARLQEELAAERQKSQQMEAKMEKQLSELDTEREQLRVRLGREEARSADLRAEAEALRSQVEELRSDRVADTVAPSPSAASEPKATVSVAVETETPSLRSSSCQTDPVLAEVKAAPLTVPVKPTATSYAGMSLPKTQSTPRGLVHSQSGGLPQTENGPCLGDVQPGFGLHSPGVSTRVQAARYKFQGSPSEQDQNGTAAPGPPSRDASPTNRDNFAAKQQARNTVTQVLSRFTSPPATGALRPSLPHSASEGGPFPGRLGHPQISLKSPTVGRIDRGTPPPIPPKKPGLSQTPSPPHPAVKVGSPSVTPGAPSKPATPHLPPKPPVELAGPGGGCPVPAVAASQVGARPSELREPRQAACAECPVATTSTSTSAAIHSCSISAVCASSRRPCDPDSPLAAASGWRPSVVPPLTRGGPVPLAHGRTLLLQAAAQGNVTLLSTLLNQDPPDASPLDEDGKSALYSAAQNGHSECVKLLLASGAPPDVPDKNGFTPLHIAAAHGHARCVEELAPRADVNRAAAGGQTALFLASESGSAECVRALLEAGADRTLVTADSWTALHAAVSSGHVGVLELLMRHPSADLPGTLLNHANRDGWTAAHIAASKGFKDCLQVLCTHSEQDVEKRDKCERTIHDVATDDCKDLLENLDSYRAIVRIHTGHIEPLCAVDLLEDGFTVGAITVHRCTTWAELSHSLAQTLDVHFQLLSDSWAGDSTTETALGLSMSSISVVFVGEALWFPGQDLSQSPWDLVRKPHSQQVTVRLKGLQEACLDELVYASLIPLPLLHNYVRLVEQYHNVVFHGLEGSCQEYIANLVSICIKNRKEATGVACDVVKVEVDENLTKEQLLETFVNCGFLVPGGEPGPGCCVVVLLAGLGRTRSLSELLGDLCEGLENRGSPCALSLLHAQDGPFHFEEGSFLIGTLSKSRLQGPELVLQQHFRWVQLRWDAEPLGGLLSRHLRRKLVHKMRGRLPAATDALFRSVTWVCAVWHQLNSCLAHLGTPEALIGPQVFLSCPVVPDQTSAVIKWLSRLWNAVVVPRVEEAIVSRVASRSPGHRQNTNNPKLSPGQQAVLRAALGILVNKAILQGCPLPRPEVDKHLSEFLGGGFPVLGHGSLKGRGKRGQDGATWRKASTSPRKKGGVLSSWSSLREGESGVCVNVYFPSQSCVTTDRCVDGDTLLLGYDDEADLMRELRTMCSSRSEPDISKIARSKEDLVAFPGGSGGRTPSKVDSEGTVQPQTETVGGCGSSARAARPAGSDRRAARPKSQLPVPSSSSQQRPPSAPRPSRSSSSTTTATNSISRTTSRTRTSSRTRQVAPNNSSNVQPREDVWVLHRDKRENHHN
ncbi:cortactin-binding protein 2-like [Arapaima gigas]